MKIIWIINLILIFFSKTVIYADVSQKELRYVMPSATAFYTKTTGYLPYYKAYKEKKLIGICYLSTDITPEIEGYNGPIKVLIGLYRTGIISGIKILYHIENIEEAYEIEKKYFDNRFIEKNIKDSFIVGKDVDNITGATVTVENICEMVKKSSSMMYRYYFLEGEPRTKPQKPVQKKEVIKEKHVKKVNITHNIFSNAVFFILLFIALNIRLFFYTKKKKLILSFMILFELTGISFYITHLRSSIKKYYNQENASDSKTKPDSSSQDKDVTSVENGRVDRISSESLSSNKLLTDKTAEKSEDKKEQEIERIIYKPKWEVKKVDEKLIRDQIDSGNLSEKEADHYQQR